MLVGYARVSTSDQSSDLQVDALQKSGCDRIFMETASGAKRERPELKAALDYMREGDVLVVWKLDRLARSLRQLLDTADDLAARQIGFQSLTEAIDTTTHTGRLVFHIFGALGEFERSLIRERSAAGLAVARAKGIVPGRRRALSPDKVPILHALRAAHIPAKEMAMQLGISRATLFREMALLDDNSAQIKQS
jgi:DNA invertase Pin-like site-specific DNA recombinase